MTKKVNLYDFDHTIYDGDASMDFIKYALCRHPGLPRYLPGMGIAIIMYVLGFSTRKQIKQVGFRFLKDIKDPSLLVDDFWESYEKNIKNWYLANKRPSDVIVSASPYFLLKPIANKLQIKTLIATNMDIHTGLIHGENCRAEEKVRRLRDFDKELEFEHVYSDSVSDMPILKLGEQGFIVKGQKILPYAEYKTSKISKFASVEFLRFLIVGCANAGLGVVFSYIFSTFIQSVQLAFILGFFISLFPSYFLNSIIVFKDTLYTFNKMARFAISYLPNFFVQLIVIHGITEVYNLYPLITYTIAVMISVPVTFVLLRSFTFKVENE